ncbi:cytochrome c oxidase assembly factor Coa1 family protein [Thermodesulfobacteriota bacterium]
MDGMQERTWWNRNWKWFVPVAGLCTLVLLGLVVVYAIFGLVKTTDVYKEAVARAKAHPAVMKALGSPIKEGFLVKGNINISGSKGRADLAIPVSGPEGKATLYAVAGKPADKWTFSALEMAILPSGKRINLLLTNTDPFIRFLGTWEYRQKNSSPTGYDNQGEILVLMRVGESVRGLYFGLERTGDHGLYYTLVEIEDIALSRDGKIAFKVPARTLYPERPISLRDIEKQKNAHSGFTRIELLFQGQLENGELVLRCIAGPTDCPEDIMAFRKGIWSQQ